jgi:hypothetical protein
LEDLLPTPEIENARLESGTVVTWRNFGKHDCGHRV